MLSLSYLAEGRQPTDNDAVCHTIGMRRRRAPSRVHSPLLPPAAGAGVAAGGGCLSTAASPAGTLPGPSAAGARGSVGAAAACRRVLVCKRTLGFADAAANGGSPVALRSGWAAACCAAAMRSSGRVSPAASTAAGAPSTAAASRDAPGPCDSTWELCQQQGHVSTDSVASTP